MYRRMNPKQLEKVIEEVKKLKQEKFNKLIEEKISIKKMSLLMEEMANAPKEEMGKRTPGERGMYEIQTTLAPPLVDRP